jgi:hypothetical protein
VIELATFGCAAPQPFIDATRLRAHRADNSL